MLTDLENLFKLIQQEPWAKGLSVDKDFWLLLMEWIEQHMLSKFLDQVTRQVDEIVEINPDLPERQILEKATQYMVTFLKARSASVRIYDPQTEQMLSYGSYPSKEEKREPFIPLEGSVAGDVVKSREPCLVPNILYDENVPKPRGVSCASLQFFKFTKFTFIPSSFSAVSTIAFTFFTE